MQTPMPLKWLKNWGRFWQALTNRLLGPPVYPPIPPHTPQVESQPSPEPTVGQWSETIQGGNTLPKQEIFSNEKPQASPFLGESSIGKSLIPRTRRKPTAKSLLAIVNTGETLSHHSIANESGVQLAHWAIHHRMQALINGNTNDNHAHHQPDDSMGDEIDDPTSVNATLPETLSSEPHLNGASHPIPSTPSQPEPPHDSQATHDTQSVEVNGERLSLIALLESLLFVSDASVEAAQLAKALQMPVETIEAGLQNLSGRYQSEGRGLRLLVQNGRYRLVTTPVAANLIETFLNLDATTRLSGPALETLAVIAYRQPVTRAQLEAIRGVDCGGVLRSLLQRGLIEEQGRLETPGRPILYAVTEQFMQHFGLTSLQDLPPLETLEAELLDHAAEVAIA